MNKPLIQTDFERVSNDVNGNPRYVCHFLKLVTRAEMDSFHVERGLRAISDAYTFAVKRANKIGGRKYHNKSYGGGIVFQSYALDELSASIESVVAADNEEYQGWTNSATWSAAYLTNQERVIYERLVAIRKRGDKVTGADVYAGFTELNLQLDKWVKGRVNWQEIADTHYNEETYN
jgi:hypothetical protein